MHALKFFAGLAARRAGPPRSRCSSRPSFARLLDVFLVVVVLHGLGGNSLAALFAGMLVGLVHDTLTNNPFGLFGFADTIVGYGTARLAQRLVIQRATGRARPWSSFAAALQQAIVVGLALMLLPDPAAAEPARGGGPGRGLRRARHVRSTSRRQALAAGCRSPPAQPHEPAAAGLRR